MRKQVLDALDFGIEKWTAFANGGDLWECKLCSIFPGCETSGIDCPMRVVSGNNDCGNLDRYVEHSDRNNMHGMKKEALLMAGLLKWAKYLVLNGYIDIPE
jgi:hypothetical protein